MHRHGTTCREFWKDKRVVVTGRAGFFRSFTDPLWRNSRWRSSHRDGRARAPLYREPPRS